MANKKTKVSEQDQQIGEAVTKTELFFQKYSKVVTWCIVGAIAVAAIIVLTIQFYVKPIKKEAVNQTYLAEQFFRADKFDTALKGDGNALGFEQVINKYGSKAGEAVYFYAGVCELNLSKYQEAINYLNKYKGNDPLISARALCCIGDAYVGLDNNKKALVFFEKAANEADNTYAAKYLLKAGLAAEELSEKDKAISLYQTIKDKYPNTYEGYQIDKYISRLKIEK